MSDGADKSEVFRHLLSTLGLSQSDYARETGVPLRTVQRWHSEPGDSPGIRAAIAHLDALVELRRMRAGGAKPGRDVADKLRDLASMLSEIADEMERGNQ